MALRTPEQRAANAAAMKSRLTGTPAEPPQEIPAYASAETLARMFDCSLDQAHRRFGSLPGVINIGTGKCRERRRYPMAEVLREVGGL